MRLKLPIILLFLISNIYSYTISGFVKDGSNGEPLAYTNIIIYIGDEIEGEMKGTASDVNGYFIIPDISDGGYTIKAMMIGYDAGEQTVKIDKNLKINFELLTTPIKGNEIIQNLF